MGMMDNVVNSWNALKIKGLARSQNASDVSEVIMSTSRAIRLLLQSSILGLGGYLAVIQIITCLLYTSPSPRDQRGSRMPSSA